MLTQVKVEYPLKQGLKHGGKMFFYEEITNVKVEYPLKQGLKLDHSQIQRLKPVR